MAGKQTVRLFDMQFVTSCISTTMVLILLGMTLFFVLTARTLSTYVREELPFAVYLDPDASEADIAKLQKQLDARPFTKSSAYVSKEQALRESSEAMGADAAEFLDYNPFSPAIELRLNAAYANADSVALIRRELASNKLVSEVDYPEGLMDSVNANIRRLSLALLGVAALLTLISFALINNTIRLTVYARRFLIHTMKLVGAEWSFIRRPFLVRNFWVGLLSGVAADVVLLAGAYGVVSREPALLAVVSAETMLWVSLATPVAGLLITYVCARVSINKYLRLSAGSLYYM